MSPTASWVTTVPDILDQASALEELQRQQAIAAAVAEARRLRPVGRCHNCLAVIGESALFCDSDCSADYQYRERVTKR